jgi:hypothetical protein
MDGWVTTITVLTEHRAYTVLTLSESLIDEYPSIDWVFKHGDLAFKTLNEMHAEQGYRYA